MFSSITSPVFSELVIVIAGHAVNHLPKEATLFGTLRKMHKVRPFQLVFLVMEWSPYQERVRRLLAESRRKLKGILDFVATKGFLDFLDSPPTIRIAQCSPL